MLAKYKKQARKDIGNGLGVFFIGLLLGYAGTGDEPAIVWLSLGLSVVGAWWMGQGIVALGRGKGYRVPSWFAVVPMFLSLIPFAAWIPLIVFMVKEDKFGRLNVEVAHKTDLQPRLLKALQIESRGDIPEALAAYKQIYEETDQALANARRQMDASGLTFDASMTWVIEESIGDATRVAEEARVSYETLAKKYADQQPAPALTA